MLEALETYMKIVKNASIPKTADQLFEDYFLSLEATGRDPKTIKMYRLHLAHFFKWLKETHSVEDPREIVSVDAKFYRTRLEEIGKKPSTVNSAMAALSTFGAWLADEGYKEENPIQIKRTKDEDRILPRLSNAARIAVLKRAMQETDDRNKLIILLMLLAGLTGEEVINLRPADIILGETKGTIIARYDKGGHREVPIAPILRKELEDYLGDRATRKWLFESQRRSKITYTGVYHMARHFGKTCFIEELSPKKLRNTYGCYLLQKGTPRERVAALMGVSLQYVNLLVDPG